MSTPSWSESAFGVIHKSYIPGRGYKAASKLTPYERNKVRAGSPPRKKGDAKDNKLWGTKPPKGIEIQRASFPGPRGNQGQSRFDGRGNGKIQLFQGGNNETTLKHEMAHVTPRRNPVHLLERTKNPVRNGREEGRADFLAHGGATPGRYRGKNEFQRGYNQVQQKMANAKEINKSSKRKYDQVRSAEKTPLPNDTLDRRLRVNYAQFRTSNLRDGDRFAHIARQGDLDRPSTQKILGQAKQIGSMKRAQVTALSRMNRARRVLP